MARKDSGEVRWPHEGGKLVEGEAHAFIQGKIHFKVWMFPFHLKGNHKSSKEA
jgi:hypothetical protein